MKNQNQNLVRIARCVITSLELRHYSSYGKWYLNYSGERLEPFVIKREVLKKATTVEEQTYLFVNRAIKQINLFLT